jgi:hypothetical protein
MDFQQITISGTDGSGGLNLWEGRKPFLYLDNHTSNNAPAPLVTVGVGCATSLEEALTLPFTLADGTSPAAPADIQADFAALQAAPFGYIADYYKSCVHCRLPNPAIDDLMMKRFAAFITALQNDFPAFDTFPETAKAGCLDLIYSLGISGFSAARYPSFHAAVLRQDWKTAALQSGANVSVAAYAARNRARANLFLAAVGQ